MIGRHAVATNEIARTSIAYTPKRAAVETVKLNNVAKPLSSLAAEYADADGGWWNVRSN